MSKNTIEDRLIYNNNKLVADKIRKTLLNIRNVPGISAKRWIWELIQNAKDVPNDFNKVEIRIELSKKSLIFSHNGSYFTIDNILGILQQISSKDSKNAEDQTGKFGTGFIGTHLLSGKVIIKGIVKYLGKYKRFKINLDRTADSSEELLKEVNNSINRFKDNMNNNNDSEYEYLRVYEQKQTDFDTSFEYLFDEHNPNSLKIAQAGLNDLINTAPVTLSTQYKKISSITIIDNLNNKTTEYNHSYKKMKGGKNQPEIGINTVTIKTKSKSIVVEEKKYFYSYTTDKCRLLYQVEKKDEDSYKVVERKKGQPTLYRDFPLIGSDKFHFPFFLDGFQFNPLETRNGLYLNGELNEEAKENREIIEHAIKNSTAFIRWLLENNIDKRYLLAESQIPEPPQKYDEIAIKWFITQQKQWRKELIKLRLLKDENGNYNELETLKLPIFKEKFNKDFFKLISEFNLTEGILPHEDEVEKWYNIMEVDPLKAVYDIKENTWEFDYAFTENDLLQKINDAGSIQELASIMDVDNKKVLEWLNKLYVFLKENNFINSLNQYKILPNKKGVFKKINEVYGNENENSIPEIINPIYSKTFGKEIKDIMIHQDIQLSTLGNYIRKKSFEDVLNEFSNIFKKKNNEEKKKDVSNEFISFNIDNQKIRKIFEIRKETDKNYKDIPAQNLDNYYELHSVWREVEDFWFNNHPNVIESLKNLNNLRDLLGYEKNTEGMEKCKNWLNNYIKFLKEKSTVADKKKIFPNQLGNFKNLEDLQYDESIPEILKDIYNDLESDPKKKIKYEIREKLLLKEITCYKAYNKLTQKEIVKKIEEKFQNSKNNEETKEIKTRISEKILSLLPNNNTNYFNTVSTAINEFIPDYNNVYNKNLVLEKAKITTELNYGIFLRYIISETLLFIQNSIPKEQIPEKAESISKIIKFSWKYQDNEFINLSIDPAKYKIFINQNDQFEKIEKLRFEEEFEKAKNPVIDKLFQIAKEFPIESDFKNIFLSQIFTNNLKEYKNKFRPMTLKEICQSIEYKLIEYYEKNTNNNILDINHKSFREVFFKLNDILRTAKDGSNLKKYFPRFMRLRGVIALKFLDINDEMDTFIDDIRRVVEFKTAE